MTPPFELEYRHIFILPTIFGWGFAVMLIFMALGGLNFNNNMSLMLVFLMGTIASLTTLIAYRNLSGLSVARGFRQLTAGPPDLPIRAASWTDAVTELQQGNSMFANLVTYHRRGSRRLRVTR